MVSDWKGEHYDRISGRHADMGTPALDRLRLAGDERVLDAGCGSGRVTERLLERLPGGSAIALDGSGSMLGEARRRLARFGSRVEYVQADLAAPPLPIDGHVDAIMSTATFHWVLDHDALFEGLAGVVRPGGQLSFQCGGEGNVELAMAAVRAVGVETADAFHMAGVAETTRRLEAKGFLDIEAWLQPYPMTFETREAMLDYMVTPWLRPATGLPDEELYRVAEAAAELLDPPVLDYVRLNVVARKR